MHASFVNVKKKQKTCQTATRKEETVKLYVARNTHTGNTSSSMKL